MKKAIILALLTVLFVATVISAQETDKNVPDGSESTTFILVRHAEKMSDSEDPGLTKEGGMRAEKLYNMLMMEELAAIYSTDYHRTKETVKILSEEFDLPVTIYDPIPDTEETERWIEMYRGKTVLISGHSNTIPGIANQLLARNHFEKDFNESDYSNLIIITVNSAGRTLLHLRY